MLKSLAAHFELQVTLVLYSVTVEESQASVASAEGIKGTFYHRKIRTRILNRRFLLFTRRECVW